MSNLRKSIRALDRNAKALASVGTCSQWMGRRRWNDVRGWQVDIFCRRGGKFVRAGHADWDEATRSITNVGSNRSIPEEAIATIEQRLRGTAERSKGSRRNPGGAWMVYEQVPTGRWRPVPGVGSFPSKTAAEAAAGRCGRRAGRAGYAHPYRAVLASGAERNPSVFVRGRLYNTSYGIARAEKVRRGGMTYFQIVKVSPEARRAGWADGGVFGAHPGDQTVPSPREWTEVAQNPLFGRKSMGEQAGRLARIGTRAEETWRKAQAAGGGAGVRGATRNPPSPASGVTEADLAKYRAYVAKHGRPGVPGAGLPDRGYAISAPGCLRGGTPYYAAYFSDLYRHGSGAKTRARRAGQLLADATRERIDLVQIQAHGRERFIVGEILPKGW